MISFDNTEIAFKSKSDKDLKRAYWLFKIIGVPASVKFGKIATSLSFSLHLPIEGMIKKTIFKQFCGGETIQDCASTTSHLNQYNIGTILDYSVEGKTSDEDFEKTTLEIIATIDKAKGNTAIPFAVFKVTGIARFELLEKANNINSNLSATEKREFQELVERIDRICNKAYQNKVPLFVDAEDSWIQDTIDRLTESMMVKYNKESPIIFNTFQMYRHDRLAYIHNCLEAAKIGGYFYGIKLVRGAYMEKERERAIEKGYPSPIQPNKEACDKDYNAAIVYILDRLDVASLCAGTHNELSSAYLAKMMEERKLNIADNRIYFAQLLGMSDHISYTLSNLGYNVAKYVPYGPIKEVMPYMLRRAEENTSVAGQTGRELNLINKELNRRKGK